MGKRSRSCCSPRRSVGSTVTVGTVVGGLCWSAFFFSSLEEAPRAPSGGHNVLTSILKHLEFKNRNKDSWFSKNKETPVKYSVLPPCYFILSSELYSEPRFCFLFSSQYFCLVAFPPRAAFSLHTHLLSVILFHRQLQTPRFHLLISPFHYASELFLFTPALFSFQGFISCTTAFLHKGREPIWF